MTRVITALMIFGLAACGSAPRKDLDAERLTLQLAELRGGELSGYAPEKQARAAQVIAGLEQQGLSDQQHQHQSYIAQRTLEIAQTAAERERDEALAIELESEHKEILLQASLREAELARQETERLRLQSAAAIEEAERARAEAQAALEARDASDRQAQMAQQEADQARRLAQAREREAALARQEAELASLAAAELRKQLDALQSQRTDRGLVMTLGDILFETGEADLKTETLDNLDKVLSFVQSNPGHIRVEGHTDDRGSAAFNLQLSQRRADTVRRVLEQQGIAAERITAIGQGEARPIADNSSESGRQQNRRVEIIIEDPMAGESP
ncbi:MAG: hypothetical protein DHS20C11_12080 [Lysobacteraceae bacterium]|nr:MAG: hypothetical protein DHS20C11_12080 [Xanthomonadaceae bacterium]